MVILAAVDGEIVPDRVVEVGSDLATAHEEELVVLHVMPEELFEDRRDADLREGAAWAENLAPDIGYLGNRPGSGTSSERNQYDLEDAQRDGQKVARDVVAETLDSTATARCIGRVGDPVDEILAEADREDARYIVIGGRKRTPVGKAVFGSATQSVLLNADCPVMTVMRAE